MPHEPWDPEELVAYREAWPDLTDRELLEVRSMVEEYLTIVIRIVERQDDKDESHGQ